MERGPEQDPLLGAKRNFNRWNRATESGGKGHVTRLDLVGEPGVMNMAKTALRRGDLSGLASTAQLILGQQLEQRRHEVLNQAGRLDEPREAKLARDPQFASLQHQLQVLEGGDISPLNDERVFDATIEYLNERERAERSKPR